MYTAVSSLVRLENKNIFFYFKNSLADYNPSVVVVNLEVEGLAPGLRLVFGGGLTKWFKD
jgi:hypothetical protein